MGRTKLPTITKAGLPATILADRARDYAQRSLSENTRRTYEAAWADFEGWCRGQAVSALPADPAALCLYLTERADSLKVSALRVRLAAIAKAHRAKRLESPTGAEAVKAVMRGIVRTKGSAKAKKTALVVEDFKRVLAALPESLIGTRDRALLLVGFAGAFRRSELVALDVADIERVRDGLIVTLRRSKTDQEGQGRRVGIPYGSHPETCPVRAYEDWLAASGIEAGPVFRSITRHGKISDQLSDRAIALVVKKRAEAAGLDPERFAGHSLRSGFVTTALQRGASERRVMDQSGHRSLNVMRGYAQEANLFQENAAAVLGL